MSFRFSLLILTVPMMLGGLGSAPTEPRFEDYRVDGIYRGTPASPQFRTPEQRMFRSAIREAEKKGPNFAAHYTIAEWGCGTGCVEVAVVDAKSGLVYDGPLGRLPHAAIYLGPPPNPDLTGIFYQLQSRLLIVAGCPNWKDCARYYFEWTGSHFSLLQRSPISTDQR